MSDKFYQNSWGNVYRLDSMEGGKAIVTCVAFASGGHLVTVDDGQKKTRQIVPITIKRCEKHPKQKIDKYTLNEMKSCAAPA